LPGSLKDANCSHLARSFTELCQVANGYDFREFGMPDSRWEKMQVLANACGGDGELQREIESILRVASQTTLLAGKPAQSAGHLPEQPRRTVANE